DGGKFRRAIHGAGFESVDRLVRVEMSREVCVSPKHAAANAVDQEQRWTTAFGLDLDDGGNAAVALVAAKHARKLFYSWRLEEARYGELFSEGSFDLRHQLDRQHGVSAEFKKVVVDTDRADSQNAFPELHKLRFDL